jgi:hypothetical protein
MALENVSLGSKEFDETCSLITASYPNSCVLWIDRIINNELNDKYSQFKSDLIEKRGRIQEIKVFHGTREENINNIIWNGFDPEKNKRSALGMGSYFAASASYSKDYSDKSHDGLSHMFVCKLATANICRGTFGLKIDTEIYDCAVDNLSKPMLYVTPLQYASIPEYLVVFHKNAS